jgi:hypothetical protein
MPSEFPGSPRLLKGALVVFETPVPIPTNVIAFQYNPDSVTRSFRQQVPEPDPSRFGGSQELLPPTESLQLTVELDAADQLEDSNPIAVATGIHPALAAIELLVYPPSMQVILGKALALAGIAFVKPPEAPIVLLVWGPLRVLPVRVESVSITEQAFDQLLNPIRASVQLGVRTLSDKELSEAGPPFDTLTVVQLIAKEVLARTNTAASLADIGASLPF